MGRLTDATKAFIAVKQNRWSTEEAIKISGMVFNAGGYSAIAGFAQQNFWPNTFRKLTDPWPLRAGWDQRNINLAGFWANPVAQSCLGWILYNFTEARVAVFKGSGNDRKEISDHPLSALLNRPNPEYTPDRLWEVTLDDWWMMGKGNAYWRKVRNTRGDVIQLWHIPAGEIEPHRPKDGRVYLDKFVRTVNGKPEDEDPRNIVHFKFRRDPANELLGWSPVMAGAMQMGLLNEGANYRNTILANHGVPSYALVPKSDEDAKSLNEDNTREEIQKVWTDKFTGRNRAANLFIPNFVADLIRVGYSPQELDISEMLGPDADMVCSLFRLNSMVLGLPSGKGRDTFSNQADAREAAWRENIIPTQAKMAAWLEHYFRDDFELGPDEHVGFDNSEVAALQEDETAKSDRATAQFAAGGVTRAEYRSQIGQKPAPAKEDEVFFVPKGGELVPRERAGAKQLEESAKAGEQQQAQGAGPESQGDQGAPPLPPANGNGNGSGAGGAPPVRFRGSGMKSADEDVHFITVGGHVIPIHDSAGGSAPRAAPSVPTPTERAPNPSAKALIAKQTSRLVGAEVQRYSEEHCEPVLASGLKAKGVAAYSLRDNEPVDVIRATGGKITDGVELKVMTDNKNNKITVKADAAARKAAWQKENSADFHTVVFDDHQVFNARGAGQHDEKARVIYYRRGTGSFRVGGMYRCRDMAELRTMIDMKGADLPAAARPPAGYEGVKADGLLASA